VSRPLSPAVPAAASAILWGAGQIINRQYLKGLVLTLVMASVVAVELVTGHYKNVDAYSLSRHGGFFLKGIWGLVTLGSTPRRMSAGGLSAGDHSIVLLINGLIAALALILVSLLYAGNVVDAYRTRRLINSEGSAPSSLAYARGLWRRPTPTSSCHR